MSNVLDHIIQKVETTPNETQKGTKAYNNMMVYLRELKLHNVKNLELAEQIFALSEKNVEQFNEIQEVISNRLENENDSDKEDLLKIQEALQEFQEKNTADRDNDVRVLKREMAVLNSNMEESLQNQITSLEQLLVKTKRTLLLYMRIIIWMLFIIIFLIAISFFPIFK